MKKFAVGCVNKLDSDHYSKNIIVENICAVNWVEALKKHSLIKKAGKEVEAIFNDIKIRELDEAKEKAFQNNWMFEVLEIIKPMEAIELIEFNK